MPQKRCRNRTIRRRKREKSWKLCRESKKFFCLSKLSNRDFICQRPERGCRLEIINLPKNFFSFFSKCKLGCFMAAWINFIFPKWGKKCGKREERKKQNLLKWDGRNIEDRFIMCCITWNMTVEHNLCSWWSQCFGSHSSFLWK